MTFQAMRISPWQRIGLGLSGLICLCAATFAAEKSGSEARDNPIKHVDAKQAQKLVSDRKVIVLDVRTPEEFMAGHIAGATNINFHATNFEKSISGLERTSSYLVHCASGGRSAQSLKIFQAHQFRSVYHLDGGINAWKKEGLPVEK